MPMRDVDTPSGLHATVSGSVTQVVLLHGLGDDSSVWSEAQTAMARAGCHTCAVDIPGFGRSVASTPPFDLDATARMLADHIGELGVPDRGITLVGHSLGAVVAASWFNASPCSIREVVLISGGVFSLAGRENRTWRERWRSAYFAVLALPPWPRAFRRALLAVSWARAAVFAPLHATPGNLSADSALAISEISDRRLVRRALERAGEHDLDAVFRRLRACRHVVLVSGASDKVIDDHGREHLARLLPSAQEIVLPGVGHWPTVEAPDLVADLLVEAAAPEDDSTT